MPRRNFIFEKVTFLQIPIYLELKKVVQLDIILTGIIK